MSWSPSPMPLPTALLGGIKTLIEEGRRQALITSAVTGKIDVRELAC